MPTTVTIALEVPDLSGLDRASDRELIEWTRAWGEARRRSAGLSRLAAEVNRRSSLELGHAGFAQRSGMRTPDAFVSSLTGTSGAEARAMVTAGVMGCPLALAGRGGHRGRQRRCVGRCRRGDPAGAGHPDGGCRGR